MSFYLLADSEESWQRTLIYQTMFENYVVFIQQYKTSLVKTGLPQTDSLFQNQLSTL